MRYDIRAGLGVTEGIDLAVEDLAVGQKGTEGSYDPVTVVAGQLTLDPAQPSARASVASGSR